MPPTSFVSVIIIFLNAAQFLKEAVESVLSQTYEDWELLLVDDGSNDTSSEIALSYAARNPSRIFYLEHERHQNMGMSASRNLGIRHARGNYVAFLDADDYWLPTKLETHVRILDTHPEAGMLFGSTKYWFSWTGRPEDFQRDHVPELRIHVQTLFCQPILLPIFLEGKTEIPSTCSVMVRIETLKKIGGFEESFRGMYEDQAFYAKICLSTTVVATSDCLAWYRQHPASHYSIAIKSGQTLAMHYGFLKWLESYCHEQNIKDAEVWKAIRRQLWLYDNPSQEKFLGLSQNNMRWIKKWILRIEESVLPQTTRDWLWKRKRSNEI